MNALIRGPSWVFLGGLLALLFFSVAVYQASMAVLTPAPRPTLAQCEVVYADSYDIRAAAESGELDVFDALLLEPRYQTMIIEAYQTTFSPKTFSARWLGMCLAGRVTPREVD